MKHPLKLKHRAAREMTCKIKGHKWVHAKRRLIPDRKHLLDIEDLELMWARKRESISYVERKTSGNVFWESLAWWDMKCVRCRRKTHKDVAPYPWYKDRYYQVKGFFGNIHFIFKWYADPENSSAPTWKKIVALPILSVAFAIEQNWMSVNDLERGSFMWWPIEVAGEVHEKLSEWVEDTK